MAESTEWNSDSGMNPDQVPTGEHTQLGLNPDDEYQSTNDSHELDLDSYEYQLRELDLGSDRRGWDSDSDSDYEPPLNSDYEYQLPDSDYEPPLNSDYEYQLPVPPSGWDWDLSEEHQSYEPPLNSDYEYQLPVPPSGWDWDLSEQHQSRILSFHRVSRCVSFSKYKNPHLERGDKVIMPPSCLREIVSLGLEFPLFFKIENTSSKLSSHCGVLEFDGIEGSVFVPEWMMNNLKLKEGDYVIIRDALLSVGKYMKLQPHTVAFTELSNPKAVLENKLRDFTCLSRGDTFRIRHSDRDFYFDVLEVEPGDAISLIETDCEVEFAAPLDYKEPQPELNPPEVEKKKKKEEVKEFRPFLGRARQLNGTSVTVEHGGVHATVPEERKMSAKEEGADDKFKPFMGRSHTLGGS